MARNAGLALTAGVTTPLVALIGKSTMATARVDSLDIVIEQLAKSSGIADGELQRNVKSVQDMGIEASSSREIVAKFVTAQLDSADAAKIARIAQDQAVIAGENSTETTERLTDALITGNQTMFRSLRMNVDLTAGYQKMADQLGKNVVDLTETEKVQSRVNAVTAYGVTIQGTYEAAMSDSSKQMGSFKRYLDDIFVALGEYFTPALHDAVFGIADLLKRIKVMVSEGGELEGVLTTLGMVIKTAVDFGLKLVDMFMGMPPVIKANIVSFLAFLAVLGPILAVGGQLLYMLPGIVTGVTTLTTAIGGSVAVIAPWALAIGVVVAALVALKVQHDKTQAAVEDAIDTYKATINTYEDYERAVVDAWNAEKKWYQVLATGIDEQGNLINSNGILISSTLGVTEAQWDYNQSLEKYGNLVETGTEDLSKYMDAEGNAIQVTGLTQEAQDALNESVSTANNVLQEYTRNLLFNIASQGLSAEAALDLAKAMGLYVEETGFAASETDFLKERLALGIITQEQYNQAIANLADNLDRVEPKEVGVIVNIFGQNLNLLPSILALKNKNVTIGVNMTGGAGTVNVNPNAIARENGGPVMAGHPYLVGEMGIPELFVPNQSGNIIPGDELGGIGGTKNYYLTANYPKQEEASLSQTIKRLDMLYGGA